MASSNSSHADALNLTELRGTLDSADKTTREGAQHPAVQDLETMLQAVQDGPNDPGSLPTNPPSEPSPPGYGPYNLPWESLQPGRHYLELLRRLVRYDGDFPLNMVDGVDTIVLDAKTKADLRDRLGAFIASVIPNHPFLAVLKKNKEEAEGGGDGKSEAQPDKQSVGDLASNGHAA